MRWSRWTVTVFMIAATAVYAVAASLEPNPELLIVMRSLQIASSFAVVARFWPAIRIAWREDFRTSAQVYAFCMVLLSLGIGGNAIWLWFWRSANEPRWMVDSWINGYFVLITYISHTGELTAPGTTERQPQTKAYAHVMCALFVAIALSIIGLVDQDSAERIAEILRPWLAEDGTFWP